MRFLSLAFLLAFLPGCATLDGSLGMGLEIPDAVVTCSVARDKAFTVTETWPLKIAGKIRDADARIICPTIPAAVSPSPAPAVSVPFIVNKLGVPQ
jgi:hypothetical protein